MKKPTPRNEESPFAIHELFFSETDRRGVIVTGNEVFTRVSGYDRETLIGRPHNIIRHPDMPKAVFRFFWERLHAGQPIAAYVKNMSADGRYYWVLASATPLKDGYISIRLKPTTAIFAKVRELYAQVLEVEKKDGVDKSCAFLFNQLRALGFDSYVQFSQEALIEELEARAKQIEASHPHLASAPALKLYSEINAQLRVLTAIKHRLASKSSVIRNAHHEVRFLPINMSVESEGAGDEGVTLAVVSQTFQKWANEAEEALKGFFQTIHIISEKLETSSFNVAASRFQVEMMSFLSQPVGEDSGSTHDLEEFANITKAALESVSADLMPLQNAIGAFRSDGDRLKQAIRALHIVCKSGRVEVTRLTRSEAGFKAHLTNMTKFLKFIEEELRTIDQEVALMNRELEAVECALSAMMRGHLSSLAA